MEPVIRSIFEPVTGTWQHLITDSSTKATAVVDPVLNYDPVKNEISTTTAEHLLETIRENDLTVEWMLEAHAHADHLTAAAYLQDQFIVDQGINVPICIGRGISVVQQRWAERYSIPSHEVENAFDRTFVDGETFNIGSIKVEVMHLPGHTPDHVGYMVGSNVLTGDSIFNPDVGSARTDFPGGSASQLWKSMTRLLNLPDDFRLYTGHDYPPADRTANDDGPRERPYSTVKEQRAANKHVKSGTKEEDFVSWRQDRDASLAQPRLIHQALQWNIQAGRPPRPSRNGERLLHIPLRFSPKLRFVHSMNIHKIAISSVQMADRDMWRNLMLPVPMWGRAESARAIPRGQGITGHTIITKRDYTQQQPVMASIQNVVVVGGSYVGINVAQQLANRLKGRLRVLLVEKNSHFQHLFAFPRFAVTTKVETRKAFIPFVPGTFANCPSGSGLVIQAAATAIEKENLRLDRKINLDGEQTDQIKFSYLVVATGTRLSAPSTLPGSEKADGVEYLVKHARKVEAAPSIAIIGGGAVGVQTATDIKELYPEKSVTLIHSRPTLMSRMNTQLDQLVKSRFEELGIATKLGSRVKLPPEGYPTDGREFDVELQDGSKVHTEFAIVCIGQTPQSDLLGSLSPEALTIDGFIKVSKTLQVANSAYRHIFALGDVADTGAHKAARPAVKQAEIVAQNIEHMIQGEALEEYDSSAPAAIHLTLGLIKSVVFRNPASQSEEPYIWHRDDGRLDMGIQGVWDRRGGGIDANL